MRSRQSEWRNKPAGDITVEVSTRRLASEWKQHFVLKKPTSCGFVWTVGWLMMKVTGKSYRYLISYVRARPPATAENVLVLSQVGFVARELTIRARIPPRISPSPPPKRILPSPIPMKFFGRMQTLAVHSGLCDRTHPKEGAREPRKTGLGGKTDRRGARSALCRSRQCAIQSCRTASRSWFAWRSRRDEAASQVRRCSSLIR